MEQKEIKEQLKVIRDNLYISNNTIKTQSTAMRVKAVYQAVINTDAMIITLDKLIEQL